MEGFPAREISTHVSRPREGVIAVRVVHKPTGAAGEAEAADYDAAKRLAEERLDEDVIRRTAKLA